jgi:hypothetical protein
MTNTDKLLKWVGIATIAGFVGLKIFNAAYSKISYTFGSPNLNYNGLLNYPPIVRVNLPMTITNRNPVGVQVNRLDGELFYGSVKISDVNIVIPAQIPANGSGFLNLQFDVTAQQLIADLTQAWQTGGGYSTLVNRLVLKGIIDTNVIRIPIETPISFV